MNLNNIKSKLEYFFVTGFYAGLLPKMPGTYASFLSMFLIYFVIKFTNYYFLLFISLLLYFLSLKAIKNYEERTGIHDDPKTAIDEVVGMFWGSTFIYFQLSGKYLLLELFTYTLLFRFFDILKPGIIGYIDKNIHTELGTILDDIIAAFFAAISLLFILWIYNNLK